MNDSSGVLEIRRTDGFRVIDDICFLQNPYGFAQKNSTFSFLVGNSTPYFGQTYDMSPKPIKNTATDLGTALDITISNDCTKAISVHENAGIAYWDLVKNKLIDRIRTPRQLKFVAYTEEDNSFYGFDNENTLFKYNFKKKISSNLHEMELYKFPNNITKVDNQLTNYLIISTDNAIYIFVPANNIINQFYQAMRDQKPKFYLAKRDDVPEIYVTDGPYCKIFRMENVLTTGCVRECCFEATITNIAFCSCNLAAATLTNGSLLLFNCSSKIVQKYQNANITDLIKKSSIIFGQKDQIFFIGKRGIIEMTLFDWKKLLQEYFDKKLFIECFSTAITIYAGTAVDYFGVSTNPNIRCIQLVDTVGPMLTESLKSAQTEEVAEWIFTTANAFGMRDFVFSTAYNYFEKENRLPFYFSLIFGRQGSIFIPQAPAKIVIKFAELYNSMNKLSECESYLSCVEYTPESAKTVLDIANQYKMYKLYLKLSISIYHNAIEPCNIYLENGKLKEFMDIVFINEAIPGIDQRILGVLVYWTFTYVNGSFERLRTVLKADWKNANVFINKVLSLLPVKLANGVVITQEGVIDAILRTVCTEDYDLIEHILETCFQIINSTGQRIPPPVIPIAMHWIFNSYGWSEHRINLLKLAAQQYPNYIQLDRLKSYIEGAGFSSLLPSAKNDHESNIRMMSMNRENTCQLFKYFDDHYIKENKNMTPDQIEANNSSLIKAFTNYIQSFIIASPENAVRIVNEYVPTLHNNIGTVCNTFCEWLYLAAMIGSKYDFILTQTDRTRYFVLMCKYAPEKVVKYLDETPDINLDAALEACLSNSVLKGSIKIYMLQSESQKAIELMAGENERLLVTLIQSGQEIILTSADRVQEEPLLKDALENIKMALTTAEKAPNAKDIVTKMWKTLFQSFQLPIWLSQNKSSPQTKQAIALFFAYFIVEALGRANVDLIFSLLRQEFRALNSSQYRNIFSFLIGYLGYRYNLSQNVESIYMEDCRKMRELAELTRTRGIIIDNAVCGMCKQPINGAGGVGMKCYECGHCFHNNATCGADKICPVCKGEKQEEMNRKRKMKFDRGASVRVRKLQRVDHGMKVPPRKNSADNTSLNSSATYFQNEYSETSTSSRTLSNKKK
ncbi:hypothetical protein TVAG_479620 [Trichomonas vaginalis G3]|uniref:Uncharacterized protein n=1 Tax=Trichomonas vaginalis (strain ATCC PRA-98 / G3) TaxID=412133 RepID=A2FLM4_TRIV3|nr:VPS8 subunit of corvet complex family [Trichomonas vaginalis G3]EAX94197.1 hypothetical protein TVAG_479620 [Trichomonas vaginalis G3]KAI5498402.1 VPS8 subunit of corvet complex family [Trichomonas vaginalis G3]|eukprot:XP_001307127.1 hypothetical protein [Trichomonas vaginalis G3]